MRASLLLIPFAVVAQDTNGTGAIYGAVTNGGSEAVSNVQICIHDTSRCAVSGVDGRFRITAVRPGQYQLRVTLDGGTPAATASVEVRAGLEHNVDIQLPKLDGGRQSVTVSDSFFVPPEEVKSSSFLVQPQEVFKAAGASQDVSRYVQTLPGVVIGSDDFRNDIIVRGGSPLENLFIVDNIEIPNINAFANFASAGGTVGILDAALIQDVTFLTGGYPAPFINRASSVLQVAKQGNATYVVPRSSRVRSGPGHRA